MHRLPREAAACGQVKDRAWTNERWPVQSGREFRGRDRLSQHGLVCPLQKGGMVEIDGAVIPPPQSVRQFDNAPGRPVERTEVWGDACVTTWPALEWLAMGSGPVSSHDRTHPGCGWLDDSRTGRGSYRPRFTWGMARSPARGWVSPVSRVILTDPLMATRTRVLTCRIMVDLPQSWTARIDTLRDQAGCIRSMEEALAAAERADQARANAEEMEQRLLTMLPDLKDRWRYISIVNPDAASMARTRAKRSDEMSAQRKALTDRLEWLKSDDPTAIIRRSQLDAEYQARLSAVEAEQQRMRDQMAARLAEAGLPVIDMEVIKWLSACAWVPVSLLEGLPGDLGTLDSGDAPDAREA